MEIFLATMAVRRYSGTSIESLIRTCTAATSSSSLSSFLQPPRQLATCHSSPMPVDVYTHNNGFCFFHHTLLKAAKVSSAVQDAKFTMAFYDANLMLSICRNMSSASGSRRKDRSKIHAFKVSETGGQKQKSEMKDRSKVQVSKVSETGGQEQKSETKAAFFIRSMREKMKIEEIPTIALGLGMAGAIPFVLLTPPFCSVLPGTLSMRSLEAQAAYGAVILSFLGGPHWGLAMACAHAPPHKMVFNINTSNFRFFWSVVPSLLAWPALLLSDIPKMTVLIFSFVLVLGVDAWCSIQGLLPPWFLPLRILLSLVVILCLMSSTLHTHFKNKAKPGREVIEA